MNEELFEKVDALMSNLVGKENHRHGPEVIRELFNLHNEATGIMEYSVSCASCRARVYNRLKEWWHAQKHERGL
jgi:hypothetical protein